MEIELPSSCCEETGRSGPAAAGPAVPAPAREPVVVPLCECIVASVGVGRPFSAALLPIRQSRCSLALRNCCCGPMIEPGRIQRR